MYQGPECTNRLCHLSAEAWLPVLATSPDVSLESELGKSGARRG